MLRIGLTILQLVVALAIIGLVLLQKGKGADAGAGFGAGASGTVFGARGARTALSRATAIFAAVFMLNSLALAYMGARVATEQPKSILEEAALPEVPAPSGVTNAPAPVPQAPAAGVESSDAQSQGQAQAPADATTGSEDRTANPTPQQ